MTSTPSNTSRGYTNSRPSPSPDAAPQDVSARYGQVGQAPWTFAQTIRGAVATLAPWLIFIIAPQLLAAQGAATKQRHLSTAEDIASAIFAFLVTGAIELVFVIAPAYYAYARRAPGVTPRQAAANLGLRTTRPGPAIVMALVGFGAIISFSLLYSLLINVFKLPLHTNSDTLLSQAKYAPITTLAILAGAVLVAPICEEIFFRGYLFGGLLHRMNFWPAALLSAFLFALAHGDIGSFVVLFVFGLVLAGVRWRVGSIWPGIAIHAANNATAALAIILAITAR